MSSDEAYAAFLNQANQASSSSASTTAASFPSAAPSAHSITNAPIPTELRHVDAYYTSEADEPFEPVSLRWAGGTLPSETEFLALIAATGAVEILAPEEFDASGAYQNVVEAVSTVSKSGVRVFRVSQGSRVVYFVLGLDARADGLVGFMARAVES
ncbi:MAG: hypothetical protein M1829_002493 [Trizodia sp. TS-e1964]|nr:MAG: hypothetical protein M1829_002493 [Trizodia sp. TS-e1964]